LALFLNYSRASKKNLGIKHYGWIKPAEDYVKLNIDAAFSVENFLGAVGAIIQNDQGIFLAGCCGTLPHVADAAREEAMALRLGLTLAGRLVVTGLRSATTAWRLSTRCKMEEIRLAAPRQSMNTAPS
jgi:hypothetical protein